MGKCPVVMRFVLAFSIFVVVGGLADRPDNWEGFTFDQYIASFGKAYEKGEYLLRESLFVSKLKEVVTHNQEFESGKHTWFATMNTFSDWTTDELKTLTKAKLGYLAGAHSTAPAIQETANPTRVDWREKGITTPVKNQGGCGSCWAFGSTEVMESHYALATGHSVVLAPQTYVNCAPNKLDCGGTGGCEGSIPELAFNYTATNGIALEQDLPYVGRDEPCTSFKAAVTCSGYTKLPANDAASLETAVATIGPIAVNVAASSWSSYGGGIFSGGCSASDCVLNHIVVAEGYDQSGEGYWLIRNSWGASWGEKGYIRITRKNDVVTYIDQQSADGVACKPFPATQSVMGESGVLFDTSYPTGVRAATNEVAV